MLVNSPALALEYYGPVPPKRADRATGLSINDARARAQHHEQEVRASHGYEVVDVEDFWTRFGMGNRCLAGVRVDGARWLRFTKAVLPISWSFSVDHSEADVLNHRRATVVTFQDKLIDQVGDTGDAELLRGLLIVRELQKQAMDALNAIAEEDSSQQDLVDEIKSSILSEEAGAFD